jgi:hypothetical protein
LDARTTRIRAELSAGKTRRALLLLAVAILVLTISPRLSHAQFLPCRIVTLNVVPPTLVQAGQPFQVTTNLTLSCDPSVLPVVRVDLLDATSSATLSTNSIPYYPSASSFTASVINQATARQLTGSWALQIQAYVISGLSGQSVASTGQLFQVNVEPYTPPVTEMQSTEMTTQISESSSAVMTQLLPATTAVENVIEATTSPQLAISTQMTSSPSDQLLVPAGILLLGFVVFGLLMFARSRRRQRPRSNKHCGQCGAELLHNEKYCMNCGAKQAA